MTLHVHYTSPPEALLPQMTAALHPDIQLTTGETMPEATQILIDGSPSAAQLGGANMQAIVIPWAGLPSAVRKMLPDLPHITAHNLHHNAIPTAELGLTLLLAAAKHLVRFDHALRQLDWTPRYERPSPSMLLHGKIALILGYGAIGQQMGHYCHMLGMRVLATKRTVPTVQPDHATIHAAADLHDLLPQTDALIITLPRTPETDGLIGEKELALLPETAVLVNIGRGRIVDDAALYAALTTSQIAAAGLDVWYNYPPDLDTLHGVAPANVPLHDLPNVTLSPHRGGMTADTDALRIDALVAMLNHAASGNPLPNQIDLEKGY